MSSKKKSPKVKTTKPSVEPVPAEEIPVPEPVDPAPEVQDPVEAMKDPEVAPDVQEPPEADVPEAPVPEPKEPEAAPEAETQQAETAPVHQKPFTSSVRDPRLPEVGSVIQRTYKGTVIEVTVLETGFEYEGSSFSSISKVAQAITGARAVNGYAFFRLGTIPGGKSPRSGAGTARLAAKINRIESLVVKMRQALAQGALALADAEKELEGMKGEAGEAAPKPE